MVKKSKLLAALDAHKGTDYRLGKQKILQKKAEKRKKRKEAEQSSKAKVDGVERESEIGAAVNGHTEKLGDYGDGWESDESRDGEEPIESKLAQLGDSDSDSSNDSENEQSLVDNPRILRSQKGLDQTSDLDSEDGGIPLSDVEDLSDEEKGDIVPYQRLTINNTSALLRAQKSIASPISRLPFSDHQTITSAIQITIPDINDDLNRELAFYKQCLDAAMEARQLLKREGVPFSRPTDYFAEMVKTDEHMGKIKAKMTDEAANKKAAAEARKQRDLKKFGKQVQVAKLQERDKAKRETMDKINILKRKRKNTDGGNAQEEDLFDVALEDASKADRSTRAGRNGRGGRTNSKRLKKDANFGYGGKKRFSKSGDAISSGDIRGFSSKKMKGQKTATPRLGKSRRAKASR